MHLAEWIIYLDPLLVLCLLPPCGMEAQKAGAKRAFVHLQRLCIKEEAAKIWIRNGA